MRLSVAAICFIALISTTAALQRADAEIKDFIDLTGTVGHLRGTVKSAISTTIGSVSSIFDFFGQGKLGQVDPDVYRTPAEVIMSKGYRFDEHHFPTEDGYILTVWRVRKTVTRNRPVMLQHGLLDCSFSWFINLPDQALPYILADAGYDVWVTNNRGNKYSRKHTSFTPKYNSSDYWTFSWDEMAKYDVPGNVNFIKNVTGADSIHYVGHSQGTTQWFAHMSSFPQDKGMFKSFVGLGPVMYIEHMKSAFSFTFKTLRNLLALIGMESILAQQDDPSTLLGEICNATPTICETIVKAIVGFTQSENFNKTRMAVMAAHEPGGTSLMTLDHWIQMFGKPGLPMYDYGTEKNMQVYGQPTAPLYPVETLKNLDMPILLSRGNKDPFVGEEDYNAMLKTLPSTNVQSITIDDWGHLDYVWAVNANTKLYPQMLQFLSKADA